VTDTHKASLKALRTHPLAMAGRPAKAWSSVSKDLEAESEQRADS